MKANGEIIYSLDLFNGTYAYRKDEILSEDNMVFEMHYTMIDDFKKIRPDMVAIYIMPTRISRAISSLNTRHMSKTDEKERLKEIKEQYNKFIFDKKLQSKFDYIFNNNYDAQSLDNLINLVKGLVEDKNEK